MVEETKISSAEFRPGGPSSCTTTLFSSMFYRSNEPITSQQQSQTLYVILSEHQSFHYSVFNIQVYESH